VLNPSQRWKVRSNVVDVKREAGGVWGDHQRQVQPCGRRSRMTSHLTIEARLLLSTLDVTSKDMLLHDASDTAWDGCC
jgi:hypothetical protein